MTANDEGAQPGPERGVTIWERLERPARGPRPALTHEQIARAGVEIADEQGLDAVSMRRLAERLGVATMALYRYVTSKDDVLQLMIDAVAAEMELAAHTGWRDLARDFAHQLRAVSLRHSWLSTALARGPHTLTPNLIAGVETFLRSLDGLGLDVDVMMAAFGTVNAFVRGATADEVMRREARRREGRDSDDDDRLAYLPIVHWLMGTGRYPTLTRYIVEGSNEDDARWQFEFGLECVLDGLSARLGI
jgi:AcrR family transcriptional regulator